jgi:hypothetical protein
VGYHITLGTYYKNKDGQFEITPAQVQKHKHGSSYCTNGTTEATISVTYNYSKFFRFGMLDGCKARNVTKLLENLKEILKDDKTDDYWEATEGNAKVIIEILIQWTKQHPDCFFEVR